MTTQSEIRTRRWRRAPGAIAVIVLSATLLGPLTAARPALADSNFDQKMLEMVNEQRTAAGVSPLQTSPALNIVAGPGPYLGCGLPIGGRANDMGARNYFSHTILNCGTQGVFNVLSSTVGLVYSAAAENIGWMNGTVDPLVAAQNLTSSFMNSPAHRANILDARYTHVGIGSWRSASGQTWTGAGTPLSNVWIAAQVFAQMPLASPAVSLTPGSVGFGDRAVGTAGPTQTVTVNNTGSAALSISGTALSGANAADFAIASNACGTSLASGASCDISLSFTPGAAGARSATLGISDNATGSPRGITLSGTGTAPALTGTPVDVVATGGDAVLAATWGAPASGASPVGYGVFVYDASGYSGRSLWVCGTCTSAVVTGLANGKQHFAMVYGHNGTAWGSPGTSNNAWVLAVPGPPANARVVPGNGSLTKTWSAPTNPGAGIDGYGVFVYDANGYTGRSIWVCATCTSATVSGLSNGVSYYAATYAHNANGWGAMAPSGWVTAGTPGLPGSLVATKANGSVTATWTSAPSNGTAIVGYGAFVYDSSGYAGRSVWVCGTCASATIDGLSNGTQYTVLVYGYNTFGWGVPASSNAVVPSA